MQYAKWASNNELAKKLIKINTKEGRLEESGIPIMSSNNDLYIDTRDSHNLVVGATGSGKTQVITLPMAKLSIKAGESFLVNDVKGEIYKNVSGMLKSENYNVIAIDFNSVKLGNNWNPLTLAYNSYKNNDIDNATKELMNAGYYLYYNSKDNDFWINASIDYFVGISLYLFENAKADEINLESIYVLGNDINNKPTEFLKSLDKESTIYYLLNTTLKSPQETRGGIVATFNQGLKKYIAKPSLLNMLSVTDFDFNKIDNEKTAIFIISGTNDDYENFIPFFVNQVINCISDNNKKRFNMLLDEFDSMLQIKDFSKLINHSRSKNVNITAIIRSFTDLENIYGKEQAEIIKMCFSKIIYLLSNDLKTLDEISTICGNRSATERLITVEELKKMGYFEAIVMILREDALRTKLLPDYKIDWGKTFEESSLNERISTNKKIFKL
jgi:type IV secretion system protein VirD4